eukprot:4759300-Pleurochrysis_carterae.AAC.1
MTLEELAAHGTAELAGQECLRRGVAAGEQATDIVQRAEGEGESGQFCQGGGAGLRLRQQKVLQVVAGAVGNGGEVAAMARPL